MKAFVLTILSIISYVFSKGIRILELKENLNLCKSGDCNSSAEYPLLNVLSKRSLFSSLWSNIRHDPLVLSALNLDASIKNEEECLLLVRELCEGLLPKLPRGGFTSLLKTFCELAEADDLCTRLTKLKKSGFTPVQRKCNDLKNELSMFFGSNDELLLESRNKKLTIGDCENYDTLCNIFHRICGDSTRDLCTRFKSMCYSKQREDLKKALVLTLVKDTLQSREECVTSLLTKCHCLVGLGPDMVEACLQVWGTCKTAAHTSNEICPQFGSLIERSFSRNSKYPSGYMYETLESRCSLTSTCNYYTHFCGESEITDLCNKLEQGCAGSISNMYSTGIHLLGQCAHEFREVDLSAFFSRERESGGLFPYKPPYLFLLITFITSSMAHSTNLKGRCEIFLEQHCDYYKSMFFNLDGYCSTRQTDECSNLDAKAHKTCTRLKDRLEDLGFSENGSPIMLLSNRIDSHVTVAQCVALIQECVYLSHVCSGIRHLCEELKVVCQELGVQKYSLGLFWKELKKSLLLDTFSASNIKHQLSHESNLHHILTVCAELGGFNEILYRWCLYPPKFAERLDHYLSLGYKGLIQDLPEVTQKPSVSECMYYTEECDLLIAVFGDPNGLCEKLKDLCYKYDLKNDFEELESIK
ncbi:uncharacterized protein T551_00606 [Pneumocystis jirovecii RU7]|uniref:Uncharacterized protein n=1 Tax=Pneumocystis jirovecii (strain RU7) TaxID=1408657 RepID=A0A0W4ZUA0_PNEJ7|nr:uncharacterized protein T551_00606 [Pneumocystis jirovecii RU7]KTW31923.1 hypothetical protein T551_00606 [Pneumocystis jirovecii RU7]